MISIKGRDYTNSPTFLPFYNTVTLTMSEATTSNNGTDIENVPRVEDIFPTSTQINQISKSKDTHLQKTSSSKDVR